MHRKKCIIKKLFKKGALPVTKAFWSCPLSPVDQEVSSVISLLLQRYIPTTKTKPANPPAAAAITGIKFLLPDECDRRDIFVALWAGGSEGGAWRAELNGELAVGEGCGLFVDREGLGKIPSDDGGWFRIASTCFGACGGGADFVCGLAEGFFPRGGESRSFLLSILWCRCIASPGWWSCLAKCLD